MQPLWRGAVER